MKICFSCFKKYDEQYSVCPYCGQLDIRTPKEPIHLFPGTVLSNRYIIGRAVGAGGFGIVYKAWDSKLETIVAVKEFFVSRLMTRAEGLKNVIVNRKSLTEYKFRKERFLAEARNMAKFGAHRNIPNVYEFFEENNTAYIVMELLQGMPLNEYLAKNGKKLDIDFAMLIVNDVSNALIALHEKNIIHRDVAPDNIFICTGKEIKIKLMDLGAAKLADSTDEVIDIILKPGFSPAEQYDNSKGIGPWSDIYALGATLYMMLTGEKPEESTNRKIKDTVLPAKQLNPDISENLNNTIMKAIAVEKHMRFKTVGDFMEALNGNKKIVPLAKEKKIRKTRRAVGIIAAAFLLAVVSGFVGKSFKNKKVEQELPPASISVWFPVSESFSQEDAMNSVIADFTEKFSTVSVEYMAIPESEYESELEKAAENGSLPNLFVSTDLPDSILEKCLDLDSVLGSAQFNECLFLDQYSNYYDDRKQMPLAIEVPLAYVITSGNAFIEYDGSYFSSLADFGDAAISVDSRYKDLVSANFDVNSELDQDVFLSEENTSPVLLSSTMIINEVRALKFEKKYVYFDNDRIECRYTYEWSVGPGTADENKVAETLLSWMLGNVYQRMLMVNSGSSGQIPEIPVNRESFETKISFLTNLKPLSNIYNKFVFSKGE